MLCDICTLIDFEEIYASLENTPDKYGTIVAPLRDGLGRDVNSDCTLCRLFYALHFPANGSTEYHLRAMSAFRSHFDFEFSRIPASIKSHDNIFLSVLPGGVQSKLKLNHWDWDAFRSHSRDKGFICRIRPADQLYTERIWARAISPVVNYALLQEWFFFCLKNHSTCAIQPPETPRCLKLINCNTGSLVYAPQRARYAALSYVWGDKKRSQPTQTLGTTQVSNHSDLDLPTILPRTIKDAMEVTRNLGIQYLWVDKYCINQGDQLEKQKQIAVMGDIYADAEVTIIAAYGEDDEAGLPGVNNLSRNTQHYAKIGNICLVSTLPRPIISIKSARWNTRGWTLQEAILSRRRLVFTADQVYFECRAMWCYESLDFPLSDFHTKNKTRRQFRHFLTPGIFSGENTFSAIAKRPEGTISQLRQYICDYSWRDLTDDSDSLNAFVGILERFKNAIPPICHHFGVPFQHSDLAIKNEIFLSSLAWDPNDTSAPRRRPLSPTWS